MSRLEFFVFLSLSQACVCRYVNKMNSLFYTSNIQLRVLGSQSHSLKCSPFIIMLSLLDRQDKWEASRKDMNSKMHFWLSSRADCSSNLYLLCVETLMPLLDIERCLIVGCQLDGTKLLCKCGQTVRDELWDEYCIPT